MQRITIEVEVVVSDEEAIEALQAFIKAARDMRNLLKAPKPTSRFRVESCMGDYR